MAERRPITAREVKSNVEGYSEMSDEAFARRFYSDRAELLSLGVALQSQRDEFTGEELYTLRSEQYFLPQLELENEELAALQTALYLLEGKFAYAEPLRLALQNLALGRPGFAEPPSDTALRVEVLDPDYSSEMPGRLAKLEGAISSAKRGSRCVETQPGGCGAPTGAPAASRTTSSSPITRRSPSSRRGCCARTGAPCRSSPRSCAGTSPPPSGACGRATRGLRR